MACDDNWANLSTDWDKYGTSTWMPLGYGQNLSAGIPDAQMPASVLCANLSLAARTAPPPLVGATGSGLLWYNLGVINLTKRGRYALFKISCIRSFRVRFVARGFWRCELARKPN